MTRLRSEWLPWVTKEEIRTAVSELEGLYTGVMNENAQLKQSIDELRLDVQHLETAIVEVRQQVSQRHQRLMEDPDA